MLRNNSSGFGEFFRYHGWLAPGVRLFRRIGFRAKALCIGLAFLLPLLMLLGIASSSARSKIETAQSEIAGVAYMKPLLELARAAQLRRTLVLAGPAEQGPMQDAVKAAFQAVAAQQQAQGAAFGTGEAFGALRQAHEALVAAPQAATADETFARHSAFIDTVLDLARGVSDGSQLVLDPELDTFHLMTMAVLRGPMQVENSARLRDMGALVLRTASLSRERRDLIVQWSSVWEHLERDVENAYRRGIGVVPGLAAGFDMPATDAAADALRKAVAGQVLAAQLGGDAQAYLAAGNAAVDKQHALVLAVLDRLGQRLQARVDGMVSTLSLQFGLSALGMALAGYLLLAFHKVMMGGLQEVSGHLHAISRGNLGTVPEPWGRDEAAQVMLALRAMQQSLRSVVATVLEGSARVKSTSQGISSATNDLSQRAEQSAASLQRTATSTEQIAATARHTADAVDSAMAIVRENALAAARGGQVIARVVETMTGIRTASNRIGEIIAVIDGIAFQTNILALNAAVEAARAGEQGRGFAVVAAEVRSLARRSADAAKEIKTLITASIGQVETGNTIVAEAGATIADIVAKAKSIDTMMAQVSSATHEQTAGVGQVGSAVRDIDRATQQNAALVEETAVATSALSDEAGRLQEAVSFFTVEKPHHRG